MEVEGSNFFLRLEMMPLRSRWLREGFVCLEMGGLRESSPKVHLLLIDIHPSRTMNASAEGSSLPGLMEPHTLK